MFQDLSVLWVIFFVLVPAIVLATPIAGYLKRITRTITPEDRLRPVVRPATLLREAR